jgi:hypothetical protein
MEETSDWRRAIGCSSVQIGRSCELRRSSPVKGSIDVSLAKGWDRRFESPRPLQVPRINGQQRPLGVRCGLHRALLPKIVSSL